MRWRSPSSGATRAARRYGRLLEAQGVWLNFQLAYRRALADHEQTVARLEQLVGASLGDLRRKEAP